MPWLSVAAIVALAFLVYGSLALVVAAPRVFPDETLYFDAGDSLVSGQGLRARGERYMRGVLYPIILAPTFGAFPDRSTAYEVAKVLNGFFFALTAVPIYLISRRVLSARPSLAVACLAVLVPSSVYVSVIMTESVAYFVFCLAIYAMVLAAERPTSSRQFLALASIAMAFAARGQFAVLLVAYVVSLGFAFALARSPRPSTRHALTRLWPTVMTLSALAAAVTVSLLRGRSPRESLGEYGESGSVARLPDLGAVAKWFVYLLADLDLYLAVIPMAVMPTVVVAFFRRARAGSPEHGAFLAVFLSVNVLMVALVARIASDFEASGIIGLHDRYLFYVAPLWLVVLVAWLTMRSRYLHWAAAVGASFAVVLAGIFPYMHLDVRNGGVIFNAVGSGLPAALGEDVSPSYQRIAAVVVSGVLVGLAFMFRTRRIVFSVAVLVAVFGMNAVVAWGQAFVLPADAVLSRTGTERSWIDDAVPSGSSVAMLYIPCRKDLGPPTSVYLTEFFNASIGSVVRIDLARTPFGSTKTTILASLGALTAKYVVAQRGLPLRGHRVREGTTDNLVLWRVSGSVGLTRSSSMRELARAACSKS